MFSPRSPPCLSGLLSCLFAMWLNILVWLQILHFDAGNVEAIACLGSYQFYSDQPEVAMIYFRRILQLGKPAYMTAIAARRVHKHHDQQQLLA